MVILMGCSRPQVACLALQIRHAHSQVAARIEYDLVSGTLSICHVKLSRIKLISLPAEMIAGRQLLTPRAFVLCMEFVGTGMIHRSQGLTARKIRQAPHLTARPCRSCRMSARSLPLSLEQVGITAAQRSRLTR